MGGVSQQWFSNTETNSIRVPPQESRKTFIWIRDEFEALEDSKPNFESEVTMVQTPLLLMLSAIKNLVKYKVCEKKKFSTLL